MQYIYSNNEDDIQLTVNVSDFGKNCEKCLFPNYLAFPTGKTKSENLMETLLRPTI